MLAKENFNRIQEISLLGQNLGLKAQVETDKDDVEVTSDDDDTGRKKFTSLVEPRARDPTRSATRTDNKTNKLCLPVTSQSNKPLEGDDESDDDFLDFPSRQENPTANLMIAKDVVRTIKPINGRDDIGVEDFIRSVKKARRRCSQPELLLDFIIAEKITQQAEKALRYIKIDDYETLYESLRSNLKQTNSVSALRSKLSSCKQGATETVQNFNVRYRQIVNEVRYAVQAAYKGTTRRRVALELEEEECLKKYLLNLRWELGMQVKPLKPANLTEAENHAIETETWVKEGHSPGITRTNSLFKPPVRINASAPARQGTPATTASHALQTSTRPPTDKGKQTCHKCGKMGHFAAQCQVKNPSFIAGQHTNRPPQVRTIQEEETVTYDPMTEEEINEQAHYEESAEYQPCMDDYNQSPEGNTTESPTNY